MARDIKLRVMDEAVARHSVQLSLARWENALGTKDTVADRKRTEDNFAADAVLQNKNLKRLRKTKLEELFKREELAYEEELAMQGLAFRKMRA